MGMKYLRSDPHLFAAGYVKAYRPSLKRNKISDVLTFSITLPALKELNYLPCSSQQTRYKFLQKGTNHIYRPKCAVIVSKHGQLRSIAICNS